MLPSIKDNENKTPTDLLDELEILQDDIQESSESVKAQRPYHQSRDEVKGGTQVEPVNIDDEFDIMPAFANKKAMADTQAMVQTVQFLKNSSGKQASPDRKIVTATAPTNDLGANQTQNSLLNEFLDQQTPAQTLKKKDDDRFEPQRVDDSDDDNFSSETLSEYEDLYEKEQDKLEPKSHDTNDVDLMTQKQSVKKKKKKKTGDKNYFIEPILKIAQFPDSTVNNDSDSQSDQEEEAEEEDPWENKREEQLKRVEKLHEENCLENNQFSKARDYLSKVIHRLPLNSLYKVVSTLILNNYQEFCPVLLQIVDKHLRKKEKDEGRDFQYLLQVWTDEGVMIYERRLTKPIRGWWMSGKILLFEQQNDENEQLTIYMLSCDKKSPAKLLSITLPEEVQGNHSVKKFFTNKSIKTIDQRFQLNKTEEQKKAVKKKMQDLGEIQEEEDESNKKVSKRENKKASRQITLKPKTQYFNRRNSKILDRKNTYQDPQKVVQQAKSITESKIGNFFNLQSQRSLLASSKLDSSDDFTSITGVNPLNQSSASNLDLLNQSQSSLNKTNTTFNDQVQHDLKRNLVIFKNRLLIASKDMIVDLDIESYLKELNEDSTNKSLKSMEHHADMEQNDIRITEIDPALKFISFIYIGGGVDRKCDSAMLLEETALGRIRFFSPTQDKDNKMVLIQLGLDQDFCDPTENDYDASKLESVSSVCIKSTEYSRDDEEDEEIYYVVTLMLRKNGRVEVYSDFDYTFAFDLSSENKVCVAIGHDQTFFYMKYWNQNAKPDAPEREKFLINKVAHKWRNRISNTQTLQVSFDYWDTVMTSNYSKYVKLYTKFLEFSIFILVAHRNYISSYDMSANNGQGKWIKHYKVSENDHVRDIILQNIHDSHKKVDLEKQAENVLFHAIKIKDLNSRYHIVIFHGSHYFRTMRLSPTGKLKKQTMTQYKAPGPIIQIKDDSQNLTGCLLLIQQNDKNKKQIKIEEVEEKDKEKEEQNCKGLRSLETDRDNKFYKFNQEKFKNNSSGEALLLFNFNNSQGIRMDYNIKYKGYSLPLDVGSQFIVAEMRRTIMINWNCQGLEQALDSKQDKMKVLILKTKVKVEKEQDQAKSEATSAQAQRQKVQDQLIMYPFIKDKETSVYKIDYRYKIVMLSGEKCQDIVDDEPIQTIYFFNDEELDEEQRGFSVIVTQNQITLLDNTNEFRVMSIYKGLNITDSLQIAIYLYTVNDRMEQATQQHYDDALEDLGEPENIPEISMSQSFSAISLYQLLKNKLGMTKILQMTSGDCGKISQSQVSDRLSLLPHLSRLIMIPIPHTNTISMIGQGQKHYYLIWRHSHDGFFTGLEPDGDLITWSLFNGKMLYMKKLRKDDQDGSDKCLTGYSVYRGDKKDNTFCRDYYQQKQATYQLLVSNMPVNWKKSKKKNVSPEIYEEKFRLHKRAEKRDQDGLPEQPFKTKSKKSEDQYETIYSARNQEVFHFKVLKLETHYDTKVGPEVKLHFHFFFKLFTNAEEGSVLAQNQWYYDKNTSQRFYLSVSTERLMEIINYRMASIYERETKIDMNGELVQWKFKTKIANFPYLAMTVTSFPTFMSPNFEYIFDYNYKKKLMRIKDVETKKVILDVEQDILALSDGDNEQEQIREMFAKAYFSRKRSIVIMNDRTQRKIQFKFDVEKKTLELEACYQNYVAEIDKPWNGESHTMMEKKFISKNQVLLRLMQQNTNYRNFMDKATRLLYQNQDYDSLKARGSLSQMCMNQESKELYKNKDESSTKTREKIKRMSGKIYSYMTKVDYSQSWSSKKGGNGSFDCEQTFTIVDWLLAEKITQSKKYPFSELLDVEKHRLMYNIFHNGKTLLQMLCQADPESISALQNAENEIESIFEAAQEDVIIPMWGTHSNSEVPILQNIYGLTPLDYALGIVDPMIELQTDNNDEFIGFFLPITPEKRTAIKNQKTPQLTEIIFDNIKEYRFNSVGLMMVPSIIEAIRKKIKNVSIFLDQRLQSGSFISLSSMYPIRQDNLRISDSQEYYGTTIMESFELEKDLIEEMFDEPSPKAQMSPMSYYYFDVPLIFDNTQYGKDFINALCDRKDMFGSKSVQILLEQHWEVQKTETKFGMIQTLLLILIYSIWSCSLIINYSSVNSTLILVFEISLWIQVLIDLIPSLYILASSKKKTRKQLLSKTWDLYFNNFNLIAVFAYKEIVGEEHLDNVFWILVGIATTGLMTRLLSQISWVRRLSLIYSMVTVTTSEIKEFLLLILIVVIAYANAVVAIRQVQYHRGLLDPIVDVEQADRDLDYWIGEWISAFKSSYNTALGAYDPEETDKYDFYGYGLFLFFTVLNIIIMMNLVIAIVNDIFVRVMSQKTENRMEALAWSMRNNFFSWKRETGNLNNMLFIVQNQRRKIAEYSQVMIIKGIDKRIKKIDREFVELDNFKEETREMLQKIANQVERILKPQEKESKEQLSSISEGDEDAISQHSYSQRTYNSKPRSLSRPHSHRPKKY